jgi:hypothetical protein
MFHISGDRTSVLRQTLPESISGTSVMRSPCGFLALQQQTVKSEPYQSTALIVAP